jgi:hypothetical protein
MARLALLLILLLVFSNNNSTLHNPQLEGALCHFHSSAG